MTNDFDDLTEEDVESIVPEKGEPSRPQRVCGNGKALAGP
jgi:hypothetical protein